MQTSIFTKDISIHESWLDFIDKNTNVLLNVEGKIGSNYTPLTHQVLRFLETDLKSRKVIIYGRDPYPDCLANKEPVATGRAFEVNGINSWEETGNRRSLEHILRVIYKSEMNLKRAPGLVEVRKKIKTGEFLIPPPDKLFSYWEEQGVLFLNRSFTTFEESGKHEGIWKGFFYKLLFYICLENKTAKHFLWGEGSKRLKTTLLKNGVKENQIYSSWHPSLRKGNSIGFQNDDSFFRTTCFKDTQRDIRWV